MGMGGWVDSDDGGSLQALRLAVALGCNFFATAEAYGEGNSDGPLGEMLSRNPGKRLNAASKMRKPDHVRRNRAASDTAPLDPCLLQTLRGHRWERKAQRSNVRSHSKAPPPKINRRTFIR
jgi:diketogulonate reductase-like aldo/keto reductase